MPETTSRPLRVAILGGGLAGAVTFRGLSKHAHLDVRIFESAPQFRGEGAGITFQTTGTWVIELMGLKQCLHDAGAVPLNPHRAMMGMGPDSGKFLFDVKAGDKGNYKVQRSAFLEQVYKGFDPTRMHTGKKLSKLEEGDEIKLYFEDGTEHICDVLLGADGIHSRCRDFVVPPDDEDAKVRFTGWWLIWQMCPIEKALECLGPKLLDVNEPRQRAWFGDGGFIMHDVLNGGKTAQYIVSHRVAGENPADVNDWKKTVTTDQLRKILTGWEPPLEKGMFDMIAYNESTSNEPTTAFSLRHQPSVPRISSGRIALVGDAAGATCPWQASGGGMALQDAYALSELFAHVKTQREAIAALQAYNEINRPIREGIIRSSYEVGQVVHGQFPGVGLDANAIKAKLEGKWNWIHAIDVLENRDAALGFMRERLA